MPYGVGGSIAQGLQSGFEMGRSVTQDAEGKRRFEIEEERKRVAEERLAKQEEDRYGRMKDEAQIKAVQARHDFLEKQVTSIAQNHGPEAVPEYLKDELIQRRDQLDTMLGQVASTGRLAPTGGVTAAAPRPNVASAQPPAAPLPDLSQAAPSVVAGSPQAQPAPAPGGVGTMPPQPAAPQAGASVAGMGPPDNSVLPASAAPPPAPAVPGGAPQAAAAASPTTSAVTPNQALVTGEDQKAQDLASRLHTGQVQLADVAPGDFAMMMTSALKQDPTPENLAAAQKHIDDFHAGITTGNNGLAIQGLNGLYGPQINTGIGQPSPYGGNVVSRQLIGIDPAHSADGSVHPDRTMFRLRSTTDVMGPDGAPLHFDHPMLGADGKVAAPTIQEGMDHVGATGALLATAQHPEVQAILSKALADPAAQARMDAYKKALNLQLADANPDTVANNRVKAFAAANGMSEDSAIDRMVQLGRLPYHYTHGNAPQVDEMIQGWIDKGIVKNYDEGLARAQKYGFLKQPGKYSPGAVAAGGVQGAGAAGITGANASLNGDEFLKTLPMSTQATVKNVAANPELLKNIPESPRKGVLSRSEVQNLVMQYDPNAKLGKDAGGLSAREGVFFQRTLTSAKEAAADLANVAELPISASTGVLGTLAGRNHSTSIFAAGKEALANEMTSQEVQDYNAMSAGFHRSLAGIEASGLAPSNSLSGQMDSVIFKAGDSQFTKLRKLAQTRQIVEQGMEAALANPKVAPQQRQAVQEVLTNLQKAVPFTQHDLTALQSKWADGDSGASLSSVIKTRVKTAPPPVAPAASAGWSAADQARLDALEAKHGTH